MIDVAERLRFLSNAIGQGHLAKDGINAVFKCPTCQHKDKLKLCVRLDTEMWHCWVCGSKGRSIASLLGKFAKNHRSAWIQRFGSVEQKKFLDEPVEEEKKVELPTGFVPLVGDSIDPDFNAVIKYLADRGIDDSDIWRFRIGTSTRGGCRRRAIITSYDNEGNLNYWTGRAIDADASIRYLNPKVERRDIIFNELDINWNQELTLVEGPFDLIKMKGNATCLLGSSLSTKHALFHRIVENETPVLLALDSDMRKKSHEIAKLLFSHGVNVRFLNTGNYKDVGEMPQNELLSAIKEAENWQPNDRLFHLIRNISSGSLL